MVGLPLTRMSKVQFAMVVAARGQKKTWPFVSASKAGLGRLTLFTLQPRTARPRCW